ncbi:MAG: hypothetical protein ACO1RA_22610 [Planctomycetaceae bacterium]
MQRNLLTKAFLVLVVCGIGPVAMASEADELRERIKSLREQAIAAAEKGDMELASQLKNKAQEMMKAAEQHLQKGKVDDETNRKKEMHQLEERAQDLRAKAQKLKESGANERELAEVHEQIGKLEKAMYAVRSRPSEKPAPHANVRPELREQAEKLEHANRRVQHLRNAAQSLKQAEANDLAHQVMEKAETLSREVQEQKERLMAEMKKPREEGAGDRERGAAQGELERLRAEVKELRKKLESR